MKAGRALVEWGSYQTIMDDWNREERRERDYSAAFMC
jgi:hypothetical protein